MKQAKAVGELGRSQSCVPQETHDQPEALKSFPCLSLQGISKKLTQFLVELNQLIGRKTSGITLGSDEYGCGLDAIIATGWITSMQKI